MSFLDFIIIFLVTSGFIFSIIFTVKNKGGCGSCKNCTNSECKKLGKTITEMKFKL